jgi:uncharacterized protein YraI
LQEVLMRPGSTLAKVFALLVALCALAAFPAQAQSGRIGSSAWTTRTINLLDGPGQGYHTVGSLPGALKVRVLRCTGSWCEIALSDSTAWARKMQLDFGRGPTHRPILVGGPGLVCFYTGDNYTGEQTCFRSGQHSNDLQKLGLNNVWASMSIEGSHKVELCTDRNLSSYCTRISTSQPRFNWFLHRSVTSFWVH